VFAFPPRALLPAFLAKARCDGLRGVVVVPFTPSDPAWPSLASASITRVDGQLDPCVIVANSAEFVSDGQELGGAQRLAVMAVDFSKLSRRPFAGVADACEQHGMARLRPALRGEGDAAVRSRLAKALLSFATQGSAQKRSRSDRGW
jgi:hypothetical protein